VSECREWTTSSKQRSCRENNICVEKRPREHSRNQIQISSENKERLSPATRKIKETKHRHTQRSRCFLVLLEALSAAAVALRRQAPSENAPPDAERLCHRRVCSLEKHKGWEIKAAPPVNRVKVIRVEAHPRTPSCRQMSERTPAAMLMKPCATAKLCNWRCKLDPEYYMQSSFCIEGAHWAASWQVQSAIHTECK